MTHRAEEGKRLQDLVVLVADTDMRLAMQGILSRFESLNIRRIDVLFEQHPQRDCGCRSAGVEFLRPLTTEYEHAILMFDLEGSGAAENESAESLELAIEDSFRKSGWADRSAAIVISPELEQWIWSPSSELERILGWSDSSVALRHWLVSNSWSKDLSAKPYRPKEAFRAVLRKTKKGCSPSIFAEIARTVSFKYCTDRSFLKLVTTLQAWFPNN